MKNQKSENKTKFAVLNLYKSISHVYLAYGFILGITLGVIGGFLLGLMIGKKIGFDEGSLLMLKNIVENFGCLSK